MHVRESDMRWTWHRLDALSPELLCAWLELRQRVFVVEQNCPFADIDGRDSEAWHLLGHAGAAIDAPLVAGLRVLPAGVGYEVPSIGRVVTAPEVRGTGVGVALFRRGLEGAIERFGPGPLHVGAQAHLRRFYERFGFVVVGEPYDEDGIAHLGMRRLAP